MNCTDASGNFVQTSSFIYDGNEFFIPEKSLVARKEINNFGLKILEWFLFSITGILLHL